MSEQALIGTLRNVVVSALTTDPRFQRDVDERRVKAIASALDPNRLGVLVVSERRNGDLVLLDGQHRWCALTLCGFAKESVCVEVRKGLSLTQEAQAFLDLNAGRRAIGAFDRYRAELVARNPVAMKIEDTLRSLGLHIANKAKGARAICAIDTVRTVHTRGRNLRATLGVLKAWAAEDQQAFSRLLIAGVSAFLAAYPAADQARLAAALASTAPAAVERRILRTVNRDDGITHRTAACIVLRDVYNKGAHKSNRLPPLHLLEEGAGEEDE